MNESAVRKFSLSDPASLLTALTWVEHATQGRSGALIHEIYQTGSPPRRVALVRFQPGSSSPAHRHMGYETIHVLDGGYIDDHGEHQTGDVVVYLPETVHSWRSPKGATLFVIWDGPTERLTSESVGGTEMLADAVE